MTRSTIELPVTADDYRIARYAAAAIALTVAEAALPSPLPGIKPGPQFQGGGVSYVFEVTLVILPVQDPGKPTGA